MEKRDGQQGLLTIRQAAEVLGASLATVYMALRVSRAGKRKVYAASPFSGRPCRMIDQETLSELRHMDLKALKEAK